jgi:hypothetical protein
MRRKNFELLKNASPFDMIPIGNYYYKVGTHGLSKHKMDKDLTEVGHCNDFRNKDLKTVIMELNQNNTQ